MNPMDRSPSAVLGVILACIIVVAIAIPSSGTGDCGAAPDSGIKCQTQQDQKTLFRGDADGMN